jgi:alginate O-acetyltransferase complex protein AlgI
MINSSTFWLVLSVSVPLFWLLPAGLRMGFLAAVSFGYLFTVAPASVSALLAWSLAVFFLAPATRRGRPGRLWVLFGLILAVIGFLAAFKYVPGLVYGLLGDGVTARVAIPLGISYYSFKLIHYLAEVARGNLERHSLPQFLCFMLLFPLFTAGPIERFDHFLAARETGWRLDSAVAGLTRIVHGLIKKFTIALLLADQLVPSGEVSGFLAGLGEMPVSRVWLYVAAMYLYVYFDFSAYSDIVIGCCWRCAPCP